MARRRGRGHLSDIFYNTGDFNERTVGEGFGFTRQFSDSVRQEMLEEERLKMKHDKEDALRREQQYPQCDINDRPIGYTPGEKF
jgi:hypothetical protein